MISSIVLTLRFHIGISLTGDCKKLFNHSIFIQDITVVVVETNTFGYYTKYI